MPLVRLRKDKGWAMQPVAMWREILDASGLADLASEEHGHDLLDGLTDGEPNAALEHVFTVLCRHHGVTSWGDVGPVLDRMRTVEGFELLRVPDHAIEHAIQLEEEAAGGKVLGVCTNTSARRGTYQSTWGTPQHILEIVRDHFGAEISLDLASSEEANKIVKAKRFYSAEKPCPLAPGVGLDEMVWCNPPGPCWAVKEFWDAWVSCVQRSARGGFLIFAIDHLRQLPAPPMPLPVIMLRKRIRFVGAPGGANFASALVLSGGTPTNQHGHVMTWQR